MLKVSPNMASTSCEMGDVQVTLTSIQRLVALSGLSWDYQQPKSAKWCNVLVVASRIYSISFCIFLILYSILMIPYYTKTESFTETSFPLANNLLTLLCLTYWALSTNVHSKIRTFHERLRETRLKFNSSVSATRLSQRVKKACVCFLVFAAFICVSSGLTVSIMGVSSSDLFWPSLVLTSIISGWITLLNHSLLLLFLSISLLLTYEYDNCTLRLSRASEGSIKEEDIEDIRGYHASLTDLVEHVVSLMTRHVAVGYVSSFLIVCFCLYNIINDEASYDNIGIAVTAIYMSTLHLIALTYIGIRLHEAAHRPLNVLLDMTGKYMPDRVIGLVTLFATKLSQRQIGISALGLMTITKDTTLAIIGTLLTYVFIVIQFNPDSAVGISHIANATTV
ncbi:uncharacterized protein LOC124275114 isoform X1 [Haliotis rubra]|uniref:uncharacterized protein LOC124275114 isoform X1 n=1 Tax=Haliotis rubra TaxID=36100 RepID=UPI001EE5BC1F|nr:uncharacterized protein LOC124275114 isoform X1 [Haliotis rubra]